MAKRLRIKDIAEMANVSPGTVDRVIHRRGSVSSKSLEAVEKVLKKVNYKPNLMVSSISMKKQYRLDIVMPQFAKGEYWDRVHYGIIRAIGELSTFNIDYEFFYYDQFDFHSCREVFGQVARSTSDGVIIGPTFKDETMVLTNELADRRIPYIYVDSTVYNTAPLASFTSEQHSCGYLLSKLLHAITPPDSEFALFQAIRVGDESANNTVYRKLGFMAYCQEKHTENKVHRVPFSAKHEEENEKLIGDFFAQHPNVHGATVLSSRGSVIAKYMRKHNIKNVHLVCLDLTDDNIKALQSGQIDFVVSQRASLQGFMAVKALMLNLAYGTEVKVENLMPLDILAKENMAFFNEFEDID